MAEDDGLELLVQEFLRRTLGLRRIGAERLAHADSDLPRYRAKRIGREEKTLAVVHQRGMADRVTRRGDHSEAGHGVALAHRTAHWHQWRPGTTQQGPKEPIRRPVHRPLAGDDVRLGL